MYGRIWVSLLLALAVVVSGAQAASAYSPRGGSIFNNPYGGKGEQYAVLGHVRKSIDSTRRNQVIRIATWRLNDATTTQKLIRAHRRGADVRMLVHKGGSQVRRLRGVVGAGRSHRSFVYRCKHGCRSSKPSALHSKFMLFSKAGSSRRVVMVSSSNLTRQHATQGWNDIYTVRGRPGLYGAFKSVFREMAKDRHVQRPYRVKTVDRFRAYFFPRKGHSERSDTIFHELSQARCHGARGGAGDRGRTEVRVAMAHWAGPRGENIARKLVGMDNHGCQVSAIYGAPSKKVVQILRRNTRHGGIRLYDSRRDTNGNNVPDKYVHMKCVMISGHIGGDRSAWRVYTGSQNFTRSALRAADEVMLRISGAGPHKRYKTHFNKIRRMSRPASRRATTLGSLLPFSSTPTQVN